MDFITNDHAMVRAIQAWAYRDASAINFTPEEQDRVLALATTGTPGDVICNFSEYLYAHFDKLDDKAKQVMANCYALAARNGWSGFNKDGRCHDIVGHVMKERGDKALIPFPDGPPPDPQTHLRGGVDWRIETGLVEAPNPDPEPEPELEPEVVEEPAKA